MKHAADGDGLNIVVIEDDDEIAEVLRVSLEMAGLRVHRAGDGLQGLDMVRKIQPAGVILDIMIPKMNGYEVCAALQTDERLRRMPIMIMTALLEDKNRTAEREWCQRMEVADFVSKPFDTDDVVQRVLKMINSGR
ncbi:response regulator [bacterium]|nr:response regulator [bacterium]